MNKQAIIDFLLRSHSAMGSYVPRTRRRPILGGPFNRRACVLASHVEINRGLYEVLYIVADAATCAVFGFGGSKADALDSARLFLNKLGPSGVDELIAAVSERNRAALAAETAAFEARQASSRIQERVRKVPRRRLEIFNKSDGKCHYCETPLTLDGKWHIEHMQPRALLGPNDRSNLVAACVPCNMKKRDMTAEEFMAKQGSNQ